MEHRTLFGRILTVVMLSCGWSTVHAKDLEQIERWGVYEIELKGPQEGNPFVDVQLLATFRQKDRSIQVTGFYDGQGIYRIRFMPDTLGRWQYVTKSNRTELSGKQGTFVCTKPGPKNHGPVRVCKKYYFCYSDGTPYYQIGTTCYAWAHQGDALEKQTLKTLAASPFNKLRMCVFPKSYTYNQNEPKYYPYAGKPLTHWDFTRFNPEFFRHFENRVLDLQKLGIEADIILFHPYDRWGFEKMDSQSDDRYLRYVVARLSAYRNVWWSMANEFDFMKTKKLADWDRFFQIVRDNDPYGHLRGIHNGRVWYDHTKPWVTHASIQSAGFDKAIELRQKYGKPCVFDECRYEGDVPQGWGNLSGRQMVDHFWRGTMAGCYVGHGETYKHPKDILWWSKGGVLHGKSPERIAFLKRIMTRVPFYDMVPRKLSSNASLLELPGKEYLIYFRNPGSETIQLKSTEPFKVDAIDTWNMTTIPLSDARPGEFTCTADQPAMLFHLARYAPNEKHRPEAVAVVSRRVGRVPLNIGFSTQSKGSIHWDFGDGTTSSSATTTHRYDKAGTYVATLTVTSQQGVSAVSRITVSAASPPGAPLVRIGFPAGRNDDVILHGAIKRTKDGGFDFGAQAPWKWLTVGDQPLKSLEGLKSFTIAGWIRLKDLKTGNGGNRIVFNLNRDRAGFDLVQLADGRLRLAVNQWPDQTQNDSSPHRIVVGKWIFFAVTYDAIRLTSNVHWYFGDKSTTAMLDRVTSFNRGPTDSNSGVLAVGNYNKTLHSNGTDRQLRGQLRALQIYGSQSDSGAALSIEDIRKLQHE